MASVSVQLGVLVIAKDPAYADLASVEVVATRAAAVGHRVISRQAVADSEPAIRSQLAIWIDDREVDAVVILCAESTVIMKALAPVITEKVPGFPDVVRCGATFVFVVPGRIEAAMDRLILPQLDPETTPHNFVDQIPRLRAPVDEGVPLPIEAEKTQGGSGLPARMPALVSTRARPRTGAHVVVRSQSADDPPTKEIDVGRLERQIARSTTPSHDEVTRVDHALVLPRRPPDDVDVRPAPAGPNRSRPVSGSQRTVPPGEDSKPFAFSTPVRGKTPSGRMTPPTSPPPMLARKPPTSPPPISRERTSTGTPAYSARRSSPSSPPPRSTGSSTGAPSVSVDDEWSSPLQAPAHDDARSSTVAAAKAEAEADAPDRAQPATASMAPVQPAPTAAATDADVAAVPSADPATNTVDTDEDIEVVPSATTADTDEDIEAEPATPADSREPPTEPPLAASIAEVPRVRQPSRPPPPPARVVRPPTVPPPTNATDNDLPRGAFTYPQEPRSNHLVLKVVAAIGAIVLGFFAVVYFIDKEDEPPATVAANPPAPIDAPAVEAATVSAVPIASETLEPEIEMGTDYLARATGSAATGTRPRPSTPRPPATGTTPTTTTTGSATNPPLQPPDPEISEADTCDETNCVLTEYDGPCCAKYKPKGPVISQRVGGVPQTLDRSMVRAGVAGIKPRVIACGEKAGVKGSVKIAVAVSADGAVTSADVQDTPDAALGACVVGALRLANFGKSIDGGSFTYPFVF